MEFKIKKAFAGALILMLLFGICTPAFAKDTKPTFTDVYTIDWYAKDVGYVYNESLMNGTGASTFTPEGNATRGMIVTILHRLAGAPKVTQEMPFSDVPTGRYDYMAIKWAAANDIVSGVGNGKFAADSNISREQMAAILYRYGNKNGIDTSARGNLGKFKDASGISNYAAEPMSWANAKGLINGTTALMLEPSGMASRAQVAAILHRFCTSVLNLEPSGADRFTANPNADYIFSRIPEDYIFASGVGAWQTSITISSDGSFTGVFYDSNLGESGKGYDSAFYFCEFSGTFINPKKLDDWTYTFELGSLVYKEPVGKEEIIDRTLYVATDAHGIYGGSTFQLYMKGAKTSKLPEDFFMWASFIGGSNIEPELPFYGIYNVDMEYGFFSSDRYA